MDFKEVEKKVSVYIKNKLEGGLLIFKIKMYQV